MRRRPPQSTRTDTLCPDTTRVRSQEQEAGMLDQAHRQLEAPLVAARQAPGDDFHLVLEADILAPVLGGFSDVVLVLEHRSEELTYELQSLMRISYAVFCWNNKTTTIHLTTTRSSILQYTFTI